MNSNYRALRKNTIVIAIANIGSRAISFILAPLYSYYLSTGQYGTMDLFTTTASLLGPLLCLDIYEATFRFAKDDTYSKKEVISSSLFLCLNEAIVYSIVLAIVCIFFHPPVSSVACIISVLVDIFLNTLTQYARGCDEIKIFAFSGVVNSIVLLSLNLLLLVFLNLQLTGWIISYIVAKIVAIIYLCLRTKVWKELSFSAINKEYFKDALKYSLPLMPTAMMWWVMNASDRYALTFFMGVSVTGIYAVASKLPSILSIFENIFYQAWQTSAIDTLNDEDKGKFYSDVFNNYFRVLSIGIIGLLIVLKPLTTLLFAKEYHDAWMCSAILLVGVMVHALGGNLGALYTVFKETKGALKTATAGALTNIVLNLIFIPYYGMMAAATTTLIGYFVVLFWRWKDMRKYVKITFHFSKQWAYFILVIAQFGLYYVPGMLSYAIRIGICILVLWLNRNLIIKMLKR